MKTTTTTIQQEERSLKATGRLSSHPFICCTGCGKKVTAFGQNLKGKIQRAGGLVELLERFKCRGCLLPGFVVKEHKIKKQKTKKRQNRIQELMNNIPKITFTKREPLSLYDNPDLTAEITATGCFRPDIFLDSGKTCDYCPLYNLCKAPNRKLSSAGWQVELKTA